MVIRETASNQIKREIELPERELTRNIHALRNGDLLAFSADGKTLAVFDGEQIHVYNVGTALNKLLAEPTTWVDVPRHGD